MALDTKVEVVDGSTLRSWCCIRFRRTLHRRKCVCVHENFVCRVVFLVRTDQDPLCSATTGQTLMTGNILISRNDRIVWRMIARNLAPEQSESA